MISPDELLASPFKSSRLVVMTYLVFSLRVAIHSSCTRYPLPSLSNSRKKWLQKSWKKERNRARSVSHIPTSPGEFNALNHFSSNSLNLSCYLLPPCNLRGSALVYHALEQALDFTPTCILHTLLSVYTSLNSMCSVSGWT